MLTAGGCLAACAIGPAVAADISGAGATFPFPIYAKWADAYKRATGVEVTYRPIGSGDGIRQIQAKEVTFGASDMPLNAADLELHGLVQFPTVVGGIVAVVNIEGVKTSELTLDGPTLARIFLGEIKSWNHGALRKLNPSVKLPSQADHRGASLRRFRHDLRLHGLPLQGERDLEDPRIGSITSIDWPVGIGAGGNEGVAVTVARTKGSIGYVEYAYATQNRLAATSARLIRPARRSRPASHRSRPRPATRIGKQAPASA